MDVITRTIGVDQNPEHQNNREIGELLTDGYKVLTSATSQYDGRLYITLVMARETPPTAMEAKAEPVSAQDMSDETTDFICGALEDIGYTRLNPEPAPIEPYEGFMAELDASSEPAPDTVAIKKSEWDATQTHIGFLVNAIYDIHQALDTYARTLPGPSVEGARLIAEMCEKAETRQLEFEVERGE